MTLIYAPTPLLIEAGPTRPDTPNAILLGPVPPSVAAELGEGPRGLAERSVGLDRVEPRQWTCPGLVDTYPLREEGGPNAQDTSTVCRGVPAPAR